MFHMMDSNSTSGVEVERGDTKNFSYNAMESVNKVDFIDIACEEYSQEILGIDDANVELKDLPPHLEYAFLEGNNKLPVIIAKDLSIGEKAALIKVLQSLTASIAVGNSRYQGYFQIYHRPNDQKRTTLLALSDLWPTAALLGIACTRHIPEMYDGQSSTT
ncbi:hypothetical protein Tco_1376748 [Tanacetum coccineum]